MNWAPLARRVDASDMGASVTVEPEASKRSLDSRPPRMTELWQASQIIAALNFQLAG